MLLGTKLAEVYRAGCTHSKFLEAVLDLTYRWAYPRLPTSCEHRPKLVRRSSVDVWEQVRCCPAAKGCLGRGSDTEKCLILPCAGAGLRVGDAVAEMAYGAFSEWGVVPAKHALPVPVLAPEVIALLTSGLTASIGAPAPASSLATMVFRCLAR